jgi:hypothetical protein
MFYIHLWPIYWLSLAVWILMFIWNIHKLPPDHTASHSWRYYSLK